MCERCWGNKGGRGVESESTVDGERRMGGEPKKFGGESRNLSNGFDRQKSREDKVSPVFCMLCVL